MHMKRILIASDDQHTRAWMKHSVSELDVVLLECNIVDVRAILISESIDLVVLDGGRNAEALVHDVEHATAGAGEVALLLVIEQEAVSSLRLSVRMPSDFFVRGGTSEELAARTRTLLWPGEEATQQELVRIDELTLNLATYQAYLRNEPIDFTYLEYALFAFLVTHPAARTHAKYCSAGFGGRTTTAVLARWTYTCGGFERRSVRSCPAASRPFGTSATSGTRNR